MAFGADFETDTGNCAYGRINCHCLQFGEAAQKFVEAVGKVLNNRSNA